MDFTLQRREILRKKELLSHTSHFDSLIKSNGVLTCWKCTLIRQLVLFCKFVFESHWIIHFRRKLRWNLEFLQACSSYFDLLSRHNESLKSLLCKLAIRLPVQTSATLSVSQKSLNPSSRPPFSKFVIGSANTNFLERCENRHDLREALQSLVGRWREGGMMSSLVRLISGDSMKKLNLARSFLT